MTAAHRLTTGMTENTEKGIKRWILATAHETQEIDARGKILVERCITTR